MQEFSVQQTARILALSPGLVRRFVRDGFVQPHRGQRGAYRFSFQDLVLLRKAKELLDANVSSRRIRAILEGVAQRLPDGKALCGVQVGVEGELVVVQDQHGRFDAESGQTVFEFSIPNSIIEPLESKLYAEEFDVEDPEDAVDWVFDDEGMLLDEECVVTSFSSPTADWLSVRGEDLSCNDWVELAEGFEERQQLSEARDALRRALELDPLHIRARLLLGQVLEDERLLEAAAAQFKLGRLTHPDEAEFPFREGQVYVLLERWQDSIEVLEIARSLDPSRKECSEILGDLYERVGKPQKSLQLVVDQCIDAYSEE